MDIDGVKQFCELLGLKNIKVDRERGWVNASCPFAPFRHKNGTDSSPSFGISVSQESGMPPQYKCFSCNESGDLRSLLHNLMWLYGRSFGEAGAFLQDNYPEVFAFEEVDHSNKKKRIKYDKYISAYDKEKHINASVPEQVLEKYPLLYEDQDWENWGISLFDVEAIKHYLEKIRGILPRVSKDYQLRFYKDANSRQLGVVFPIISRGKSPSTLDLWVRLIELKRFFRLTSTITGTTVDYHAPASWFGEHLFDKNNEETILVEGAFDLLRLRSLGVKKNILASMGNPSKEQLGNPNILTTRVYLGFDSDEAGARFALQAVKEVHAPKLFVLNWVHARKKDAGDLESYAQYEHVWDNMTMVTRQPQGIDILK